MLVGHSKYGAYFVNRDWLNYTLRGTATLKQIAGKVISGCKIISNPLTIDHRPQYLHNATDHA
ncbi:protein of unknown function [Denitratisoma oestradiolicum]|uniref:Uncharacterized protein n=1 Tax=Denitratisoma oestradiolicum TaxID=311182 RepID=A0A6S6XYY9_9PROT|nr:protein of unknown function [Denitratisoma oestradiolicum]